MTSVRPDNSCLRVLPTESHSFQGEYPRVGHLCFKKPSQNNYNLATPCAVDFSVVCAARSDAKKRHVWTY